MQRWRPSPSATPAGSTSSTSGRCLRTASCRSPLVTADDNACGDSMGLVSGLLLLPLAPVRGTVWIAEQIAAQAARELDDETSIRRRLAEAERDLELGLLSVQEYEAYEDELLDRLEAVRERESQEVV